MDDENGNYNEQEVELHTIRNERESQSNSRIERRRDGQQKSGQNKNRGVENIGIDHIVDSYEIYGEDKPDDDSEIQEHEEYVQASKKRTNKNQ